MVVNRGIFMKEKVIKADELPKDYIGEALTLNEGEAIEIPTTERRKVLAGLHYYTHRIKTHDGWIFKTKKKDPHTVYLLRVEPEKKKEAEAARGGRNGKRQPRPSAVPL